MRVPGGYDPSLDKFLGGTVLPTNNVTVEQAELVVTNFLSNALSGSGCHAYIHIFSFPKKTEEAVPLSYILWLGPTDPEPYISPGNTYWWESGGE